MVGTSNKSVPEMAVDNNYKISMIFQNTIILAGEIGDFPMFFLIHQAYKVVTSTSFGAFLIPKSWKATVASSRSDVSDVPWIFPSILNYPFSNF